jgi:hypothetical protein
MMRLPGEGHVELNLRSIAMSYWEETPIAQMEIWLVRYVVS